MSITSAMVEDERGQRVPVVAELAPAPRWPWKTPPRQLLSPDAKRWMLIEGMAGLGVIALAIIVSIMVALAGKQAASTAGIIVLVLGVGGYLLLNQLHNWHWSGPGRRFAARAVAHSGTCPSCGYGIAGVPSNDGGLTTCPECASLWRVAHRDSNLQASEATA
jgi:hypothetical protein